MARQHEGGGRIGNSPGELQLAELRASIAPARRLVELLDKAEDRTLGWSAEWGQSKAERDELLAHPDLTPEMVCLLIDLSCEHFEQDHEELEQILERGHWNEIEKTHVRKAYSNPYGGSPIRLHYTPWQNWAERAEGVFGLAYPPEREYATPSVFHPRPATDTDRQRGHDIIVRRVHWGTWLCEIIRDKPEIALERSERIRASNDPLAIKALDNPTMPLDELIRTKSVWEQIAEERSKFAKDGSVMPSESE